MLTCRRPLRAILLPVTALLLVSAGVARAEVPVQEIACVSLQSEVECRSGGSFVSCSDAGLAFAAQELRFRVTVDTDAHVYALLQLPGGAYTVVHVPISAGSLAIPAPGSFVTEIGTVEATRVIASAEPDPTLDAIAGQPSVGIPEAFLLAAARFAQMRSRCAPVPSAAPMPAPAPSRSIRGGAGGAPGGGLLKEEERESAPEEPGSDEGGAFIEPTIVR